METKREERAREGAERKIGERNRSRTGGAGEREKREREREYGGERWLRRSHLAVVVHPQSLYADAGVSL